MRSRQSQPQPPPVYRATVSLGGLEAGPYAAWFVDPWAGSSLGMSSLASEEGNAVLQLPAFTRDIAFKVMRQ